jgi:hypothetical protein
MGSYSNHILFGSRRLLNRRYLCEDSRKIEPVVESKRKSHLQIGGDETEEVTNVFHMELEQQ